jgi:hypothetical protein
VIDDFRSQTSELLKYYQRLSAALNKKSHELSDRSTLAEQTLVNAATAFEGFLSDIFIAFLNRDSSKYQDEIFNRIKLSVREKYGEWHAQRMSFAKVQHVNAADVKDLLDPTGWNITFKSAEVLKTKAGEWLAASVAKRVKALTEHDERVIDTTKAIRDFIAHRSESAKRRMNETLDDVGKGPPNRNLGRGAHQIHKAGSFLKAEFGGSTRVELFIERLREIAEKFRMPHEPKRKR